MFYLIAIRAKTKSIEGERRKHVPFSMAIENVGLMHECYSQHLRMGTERMQEDKDTEEDGKHSGMKMERCKAGTK